jgi:hypothetical protein
MQLVTFVELRCSMSATDGAWFRDAPGRGRSCGLAAAVLLITLLAAVTAGLQLYSSFAPYDDEGYVLLSLRMFRAGHPLYDSTATQYGPAFFILQDGLHSLLQLPVTHDVARARTGIAWILTAALTAFVVWRLTSRAGLTLVAGLGAMWHLDRLGLEPGHPQDVAILGLATILTVAATLRGTAAPGAGRIAALGLVVGGLAMTKLNLGVLFGLACGGALFWSTPSNRWSQAGWGLCAFTGVAIPFMLARLQALTWDGSALPMAIALGWIGCALNADWAPPSESTSVTALKPAALFVAVALLAAGVFCGIAIWHGTSAAGLWHGLIGQHRGFLNLFYHHPPLPTGAQLLAIFGLSLAIGRQRNPAAVIASRSAAAALLGWCVLRTFGDAFRPISHGLDDRAAAGWVAAVSIPLAWALLEEQTNRFARRLLCLLVLTQPLGAYPTPGTQMAIGALPGLIAAVVLTGDLLNQLDPRHAPIVRPAATYVRGLTMIAILCLAARGQAAWRQWSAAEPLALPGAAWLRLPAEQAAARRNCVEYLREHADVFVASPTGCCSLYLWSGLAPPTTRNVTFWEVMLSDAEQRAVIDALEHSARPLLVIDHSQAPVIYKDAPLNRYLERRFIEPVLAGPIEVYAPPPRLAQRPK